MCAAPTRIVEKAAGNQIAAAVCGKRVPMRALARLIHPAAERRPRLAQAIPHGDIFRGETLVSASVKSITFTPLTYISVNVILGDRL
jgi:hypothetical protein